MDRQRRVDDQDERRLHVERDRHEVLLRVVGRLLEQRRPDRHHRAGRDDQRIAVGRRALSAAMPTRPALPGLFSITTGLPSACDSLLGVEPHGDVHAGAGGEQRHDGDLARSDKAVGVGRERAAQARPNAIGSAAQPQRHATACLAASVPDNASSRAAGSLPRPQAAFFSRSCFHWPSAARPFIARGARRRAAPRRRSPACPPRPSAAPPAARGRRRR